MSSTTLFNLSGEQVHPAYGELTETGIRKADMYCRIFEERGTSLEALEKYVKRLEPKNIFDYVFCYFVFDGRVVKNAAAQRILYDRKMERSERKAKEAMGDGASQFVG